MLEEPFERPKLARDPVALRSRFAFEIGAQRIKARVQILKIGGQTIEPLRSALAPIAIHDDLVETLDTISQKIESRHVVLDLIDSLQIRIEYENRLFELINAAGDDAGAGGTCERKMRRGHHHEECCAGDDARHGVDAGIDNEAGGKGRRRNRHGNNHNEIEKCEARSLAYNTCHVTLALNAPPLPHAKIATAKLLWQQLIRSPTRALEQSQA